jgi:hypothetical protein
MYIYIYIYICVYFITPKLTKTFENMTHTNGQYSVLYDTVLFQCILQKQKNTVKYFQAGQSAIKTLFSLHHNFRRIYNSNLQIPIHDNLSYISPPIRTTDVRSVETP